MSEETATQDTGVEQQLGDRPLPEDHPRAAMLKQIAENRTEVINRELAEAGDPPIVPEAASEQEVAPEPAPEPEPTAAPVVEPVKMVTLRVDGKDIEVPEDKIREAGIRTLQKDTAADQRLAEATRILREVQGTLKSVPTPVDVASQQAAADLETRAKNYTNAIRYGTEEEALNASKAMLLEVEKGRQAIPPEPVIRALVRSENEVNDALRQFRTDYPEIVADKNLMLLAINMENERLAAIQGGREQPISHAEAFKRHGDAIREWKGGIKPENVANLNEKRERKASIQQPQVASARKAAPIEVKEPSASDVINEIRKRRGQA